MTPYPGMDMASLQALAQQFGPSEDDRRYARGIGALQLMGGLLGTRKGFEGQGIGNAVSQGLLGYQTGLKGQTDQRQAALSQAMELQKLGLMQQNQTMGWKLVNGGDGQQPGDAPPSALPQPSGMPPSGSPATTAPYIPAGGTPPQAPQGMPPQGPQQPTGTTGAPNFGGLPPWANNRAALGFALMGNSAASTAAANAGKLEVGRNGVLTQNGRMVGRVTDGGIIQYNQDGTQQFVPDPTGAITAAASRNAQIKGAETTAVQGAKYPFETVETQGPQGQPQVQFKSALLGTPPGTAPQPGASPAGPSGPVTTGPSPVAIAASKAEQEAMGKGYAAQSEKIDNDAAAAQVLAARIKEMAGYEQNFRTGMGTDARLQVARAAQAAHMPDSVVSGIAGGDITAMQAFRKQSVQMAFEAARQQMGGVPRNVQEIQYQMEANPSLTLEPGANKIIEDWVNGVSQYQAAKQQARDQWLQDPTHNTSMRGFEGAWNATNSPTQFIKSFEANHAASPGQAQGRSTPAGMDKITGKPLYRRADGKLYLNP